MLTQILLQKRKKSTLQDTLMETLGNTLGLPLIPTLQISQTKLIRIMAHYLQT